MRLKHAFKYQVKSGFKAIVIFYGVMMTLRFLALIITMVSGEDRSVISAFESNTCVYMLFLGAFSILEDFKFFIQNGYSRKSMIKLYVMQFLVCSLTLAFLDILTGLLFGLIDGEYHSLFQQIYGTDPFLLQLLWFTGLYFVFGILSFFITLIYQRLGFIQRILFMVILPCAIIVLVPVLNMVVFDGMLLKNLTDGMNYLMGTDEVINLFMPLLTMTSISIVFSLLSYATIRKASVSS